MSEHLATLEVDGVAIDDRNVVSFTGHEAISECGWFEVTFLLDIANDPYQFIDTAVGTATKLTLHTATTRRHFHGEVTEARSMPTVKDGILLRIRIETLSLIHI